MRTALLVALAVSAIGQSTLAGAAENLAECRGSVNPDGSFNQVYCLVNTKLDNPNNTCDPINGVSAYAPNGQWAATCSPRAYQHWRQYMDANNIKNAPYDPAKLRMKSGR